VVEEGGAVTAQKGLVQKGLVQKGLVQKGLVQKGLVQKGLVQKGLVQKGLVQKGLVQKGLVQKGLVAGIPLSALHLSLAGGWPSLLLGTPFEGVPLDALTFGQILAWVQATLADPNASTALKDRARAIGDLGLDDFDPDSPLGRITIGSLLLLGEPVSGIAVPGTGSNLANWQAAVADQGFDTSLVTASTLVIDLDAAGVDLARAGLGGVRTSSVAPANTLFTLMNVAGLNFDSPLGQVRLAELPAGVAQAVVDCSAFNGCSTGTLADAKQAGKLVAGATFDALSPGLPARITIDETIRAMIESRFFPWENALWSAIGAGRFAIPKDSPSEGPGFSRVLGYRAGFDTGPGGAAYVKDATLDVELPPGTAFHDAIFSATGPRAFVAPYTPDSTNAEDFGNLVRFHLGDIPSGSTLTVTVEVTDALSYAQSAPLTAVLSSTTGADSADITLQGFAGYDALVDPPGNNSPATAPLLAKENRVYFGGITGQDDEDYVKIPQPPAHKRLIVSLGSAAGAPDLAVFKPTTTDPSDDPHGLAPSALIETGAGFGTQQPAPLPIFDVAGFSLLDASTHSGTGGETVAVGSAQTSQDLLVRISSPDGKPLTQPYALRYLYVDEPVEQNCPSYTPPNSLSLPSVVPPTLLPGTNTIFLVDPKRMTEQYGLIPDLNQLLQLPTLAGQVVLNSLANLDGEFGVHSAVIPITGLDLTGLHPTSGVVAARAALDANPCSVSAANAMADAVKDLLDTYLTPDIAASLKNIVIVGGDDQIPFHRVPGATFDVREEWHEADLRLTSDRDGSSCAASPCDRRATPLSAAAAGDYILTDDAYADRNPIAVLDRKLFVSDYGLGRLVESPSDVYAAVSTFLNQGGLMQADSALSTGYGAWNELPPAIASEVSSRVDPSNNKQLTGQWSKAQLQAALGFSPSGTAPKLISINAHMDETGLVSGAPGAANGVYSDDDVYDTAQLPSNVRSRLAGRLLFTIGCHAGGTLPDSWYGTGAKDWAQVLGGSGGYIAQTGFGIADDRATAQSERMISNLARQIGLSGSSLTAGQALVRAKQDYLNSLGLELGYDEKVLMQFTYFGLPMYALPAGTGGQAAAAAAPGGWTTGSEGGLATQTGDFTNAFTTLTAGDGSKSLAVTGEPDGQQISDGNPILPKFVTTPPAQSGLEAHGAGLIGATSSRTTGKVTIAAATSGGPVRPHFVDEIGFPSSLTAVANGQATVIAGRVSGNSTGTASTGTTEQFDTQRVKVFYSSSSDWTDPWVNGSNSAAGGQRTFRLVSHEALAAAWVLLQRTGNAAYERIDLAPQGGNVWAATIADPGPFQAFAQGVDLAGNVGWDLERGYLQQLTANAPSFDAGANATIGQGGTLMRELGITDPDSTGFTGTVDYGFGPVAIDIAQGPDGVWRAYLEVFGVAPGTFPVSITICDSSGLCTTKTFDLTVTASNHAPEASVTLDTLSPTPNHVLVATATGSDVDGDPVTLRYQWWDGADPIAGATGSALDLTTVPGPRQGKTITVTVIPNDGQVDGGQSNASAVVRLNQAPTVSAGPDAAGLEGSPFTSSGTFNDPDGDPIVTATVNYGDGTGVQTLTLGNGTFALSHVYADNCTCTVTVSITDAEGGQASDTAVATIANVAPTLTLGTAPAATPLGATTSLSIPYGDVGVLDTHTVSVNWGDGTAATSATVNQATDTATATHVYAAVGTYVVSVTVTDDDGGTVTEPSYVFAVVFDNSAGYLVANGQYTSPVGSWPANPTASGQAEFGMNLKKATATGPVTGKMRFTYDIAPFDHGCAAATCLAFDTTSLTTLTFNTDGTIATLRANGSLTGTTTAYSIVVVALDGSPDKIRIRLFKGTNVNTRTLVYDSQMSAGNDETATPTTVDDGGSIQVKKAP
jgi:hypothetical protein